MEVRPYQEIPPDLVGTDLEGYHILDLIGLGGMGAVYRAQASDTGQIVALKLISSRIALDPVHRRRFEREMEVAEQLRHANILPVLYVGRQPEHLFMVMPYVAGGSLDRLLDERRCLSPTFAARLVTQIGAALDVAHNHGIVH